VVAVIVVIIVVVGVVDVVAFERGRAVVVGTCTMTAARARVSRSLDGPPLSTD
jgi:hypothetical protein